MTNLRSEHSLELKKHVNAIHCTNTLSLVQRKIANALLFHCYDALLTEAEHEISINYLCKLIGYSSHDYQLIKKALVGLISTVVEWNLTNSGVPDQQEEWNASSIIASASIRGGTCRYAYSPAMRRLLHMPAMYGRLNMGIQARFKSSYGLALYENSIRYQNLKFTPWFELPMFRRLMGVGPNRYLVFRDFKRRVLDKALAEVNEYTTVQLTPEYKRQQRQVTAIRFAIQHRLPDASKPQQAASMISDQALLALKNCLADEFALSGSQQSSMLKQYDADCIQEKITIIKQSSSFKQGKIHNLASYLVAALQSDYKPGTDLNHKKEQALWVAEQQAHQQQVEQAEQAALQRKYSTAICQQLLTELEQLPKQLQDTIREAFLTHLNQTKQVFLLRCFTKQQLRHPAVFAVFRSYVFEHYPGVLSQPISFEQFCTNGK